jgi:hypothetical protein
MPYDVFADIKERLGGKSAWDYGKTPTKTTTTRPTTPSPTEQMAKGWESAYTTSGLYDQYQTNQYAKNLQKQYQSAGLLDSMAGWEPYVGLGAGAGQVMTGREGLSYAPEIPEGEPYALYESGGLKWPWQTPKGVGFIAPWTPQAQVEYYNPITGQQQTSYIQAGGAPEQITAGQEFLSGLTAPGQAAAMPEGWFASPYDIPPEIAQNPNYEINYDPTMMAWRADPVYAEGDAGMTALEEEYMRTQMEIDRRAQELQEQQFAWEREQAGQLSPWQEAQLDLAYRELEEANNQSMSDYEQAMIQLYQQQQAFTEQQAAAELAANPVNWLQYSALTGETPVVQPWMLPLMPQEYQGLQIGEPIPGWSTTDMSGMPTLLNPSAQYWARMTPEQRQMYLGYIQALTGQSAEDIQFRMWSAAPSGGGGLTYSTQG